MRSKCSSSTIEGSEKVLSGMAELTAWAKVSNWNADKETDLSPRVRVVRKSIEDIVSSEELKRWFGPHEIHDLEGLRYWVRHEFSGTTDSGTVHEDPEAIGVVDRALLAAQLLKPIGTMNVRFVVAELAGQPCIRTVFRGARMTEPIWARVSEVNEPALQKLPKLFERLRMAESQALIRVVNPLRLLGHGLQASEVHIRILLCTAGLDVLLMAGGGAKFSRNLCNLLGADAFVFPPGKLLTTQPKYRVGSIAGDLYELRNKVAHGLEIPRKFREETGFLAEDDTFALEPIPGYGRHLYRDVLGECAVFLLCKALKRVLLSDALFEEINSTTEWKKCLARPIEEEGSTALEGNPVSDVSGQQFP